MKNLTLIISFLIVLFSFQNSLSQTIKTGEKFKVLGKKDKAIRMYIFSSISDCNVHKNSFKIIAKEFSGKQDISIKLILSSINRENAENYVEQNNLNLDVIGDRHNVYYDLYGINVTPFIMILDNEGYLLDYAKLGDQSLGISDIKDYYSKEKESLKIDKKNTQEYLSEFKRIKVLEKDGDPVISDIFMRHLFYDEYNHEFYYRNKRSTFFDRIDSAGIIFKSISKYNHDNLRGWAGYDGLSWFKKDSLIGIYNQYGNSETIIQFYDINKDSIVHDVYFSLKQIDSSYLNSYHAQAFSSQELFHVHYDINYDKKKTFKMNNEKTSYLFDYSGNVKVKFGEPDPVFQNHKLSIWFEEHAASVNDNSFITYQRFSNILKYWNFKGEKIKELTLDMGQHFREINEKTVNFLLEDNIPAFSNNITRTDELLYDKKKEHSLIAFLNEIYPEGVTNPVSPHLEYNRFIVIFDDEGKRLTPEAIEVPSSCIPFYYNDDMIYASEINEDKELEIVVYELKY